VPERPVGKQRCPACFACRRFPSDVLVETTVGAALGPGIAAPPPSPSPPHMQLGGTHREGRPEEAGASASGGRRIAKSHHGGGAIPLRGKKRRRRRATGESVIIPPPHPKVHKSSRPTHTHTHTGSHPVFGSSGGSPSLLPVVHQSPSKWWSRHTFTLNNISPSPFLPPPGGGPGVPTL